MQNLRSLPVWTKSHQLNFEIYQATQTFPQEEFQGLTRQIHRAASAITANIAAGYDRRTQAELAHFLQIAIGSASELEYHFLLATDLGLIEAGKHKGLAAKLVEVKRLLLTLMRKVGA
jgi:four helix bundle protein